MEPQNCVVREPDLAVSMIHPNPIVLIGGKNLVKMNNKLNFCVDSWCPIDRIHDHHLFKSKPHFD